MEVYDFGIRLRKLRNAKGLSQSEVSKKIGIAKGTISTYERNVKNPSMEIIIKLAVLYNVSVDYILGFTDRACIYLDDLSKENQQVVIKTISTLKDELNRKDEK